VPDRKRRERDHRGRQSHRRAACDPSGGGRRRRFCGRGAGKADNIPARIAFADGALSAPNLGPLFRGRRVEIVLQPNASCSDRWSSGAGGGFPRGYRACADRPPDAVDGGRGGVRLHRAGGLWRRHHHHMIAATTRKVATGYAQAWLRSIRRRWRSAPRSRTSRPGQGVRAERARHLDAARLSRMLQLVLGVVAVVAVLSSGVSAYVASSLGAQEDEVRGRSRCGAPRSAPGATRRPLADRSAGAAQIRDAGERNVLETLSRLLPDTPMSPNCIWAQQAADLGHHQRCAVADPADRAVAALHPRHLLCADHARAVRSGDRFHIEARVESRNSVGQRGAP